MQRFIERDRTLEVSRGFGIRVVVAWNPPENAAGEHARDYTPAFVVRDTSTGANVELPSENAQFSTEADGFSFDLVPTFTEQITPGSHPYVASAELNAEKYETQSGVLIVGDISFQSTNEKILDGLRRLMDARACGGDVDLIALSMPGGMNYSKMSGRELGMLISDYANKVAVERGGVVPRDPCAGYYSD